MGDVVALGGLGNLDALGKIVGPGAEPGLVKCLMGDPANLHGNRPVEVEVEVDQLLVLVRKAIREEGGEGQ